MGVKCTWTIIIYYGSRIMEAFLIVSMLLQVLKWQPSWWLFWKIESTYLTETQEVMATKSSNAKRIVTGMHYH